MLVARLTNLFLGSFKTFRDEVLPLDDLTVLTGLNSSGKSNALDGLDVLVRLATGDEITDALDGHRRDLGPVRGGSVGCAPHGLDRFTLGCTVEVDGSARREEFVYEVTVQVKPEVRVVRESLRGPAPTAKSGSISIRDLIVATGRADEDLPGIAVQIDNGKRGSNPTELYRDSRLVLTQVALRLVGKNQVERAILHAVDSVVSALRAVFELDPVPSAMRNYVSRRDVALKRDGSNLSAALANLQETDPDRAHDVVQAIGRVAANSVINVKVESSTLDDVMFALVEQNGESTPAREMSDGLLRFSAIATALQSTAKGLDVDLEDDILGVERTEDDEVDGRVLVVIEEIENGLHPSQARLVLEILQTAIRGSGLQVLVTTHSPAILDVLTGAFNDDIIVCYRSSDGFSHLRRITELEGYAAAMAHGEIGDLVTNSELVGPAPHRPVDTVEFLRAIGL